MQGLMSNRQLLISSLLEHCVKNHGETLIVHRELSGKVKETNYIKTELRIKKLANALKKNGILQGDTIGTLAWSNLRHLELYYGVAGIGAICHTINPRLFKEQLTFIINDAKDKFLFVDLDLIEIVKDISDKLEHVEKIILLCSLGEMPKNLKIKQAILNYEEFINENPIDDWPSFSEGLASSLCYTSGTTGNPKGVLYSHRSTILHTIAAANPDALNISSTDVIMPIAPMFHANAWGIPYIATMVGAKLVLPGRQLDGKSIYELIEQKSVTFTAAVPTVWLMLLQYLNEKKIKLKSLKTCVIGGSACPKFMIEQFYTQHGVEVIHAWGMTETSPLGTVNRPLAKHACLDQQQKFELSTKQGRPIYGVEIKITDDNNNILKNDGKTFGNLWVRGPWISSGYINIDDKSKSHDKNGWFLTGDVATIDQDSYMHITDRVKDVIKSGGEWISSIEIENMTVGHPKVKEAAVIGAKHPKWDERPLLIVVKESKVSKKEIFDFLSGRIAKWWMPDDIVFTEQLPYTATGKIKKVELKKSYEGYYLNFL